MDSNKRTKVLAGGLLATLVFYGARPDQMIREPLDKANVAFDLALEKSQDLEQQDNEFIEAQARLRKWTSRSLPPDNKTAQRLYSRWVNDLAESSGLTVTKISNGAAPDKFSRETGKQPVYGAVEVILKADASLEELSRFLYRFERTDLTHRVKTLSILSRGIDDPILETTIVAEGVCMKSAKPRLELFPKSNLGEGIDEDSTEFKVADRTKFPKEPGFQIQVGRETMLVTEITEDGKMTVERGIDGTEPGEHVADAKVQYVPIAAELKDVSFEQYQAFLDASPFRKPEPEETYEPEITIASRELIRGRTLEARARLQDYDKELGKPVFSLEGEKIPEGMEINAETGKVTWKPANDLAVGEYKATAKAFQADKPEEVFTKEFVITLKDANKDPTLTVPRDTVTAWLGQTVEVPIQFTDDKPDEVTFEIEGVDDAYVDKETSMFRWLPSNEMEPSDIEVKIKATDGGGKSVEKTLRLAARDDEARYTRFVGGSVQKFSVEGQEELVTKRVGWLHDTMNRKSTRLEVGTKINISDISATVESLSASSVTLKMPAGTLLVKLDNKDLRSCFRDFKAKKREEAATAKENAAKETTTTNEETAAEGKDSAEE